MAQNRFAGIRAPRASRASDTAAATAAATAGASSAGVSQPQLQQPKHAQQAARAQRTPRNQRQPRSLESRSRKPAAGALSPVGPHDGYPEPRQPIRIDSPTALLAAVPLLLGFAPASSLVVVGTESPRARVRVTMRYDLPDPPDMTFAAEIALHAVGVLAAQRIQSAVAVGYGPADLVGPLADALREHASRAGITVTELLRTEGHRYWSYCCAEPGCCPPEGVPFDLTDHQVTQAFACAGEASVLLSRAELAATVASVDGELAETMCRATRKAEQDAARLVARTARTGRKASVRKLVASTGLRAVASAIDRYRSGDTIGPEAAAWLTVVLRDLRVRDDAWSRMLPEYRQAHLRLWTDLTRMARPGYVPAPASLLAFVAWQSGNGALANVALERALTDDPDYSMARLLKMALDSGAPPSLARLPMSPEEVAASYDALEAEPGEDSWDPVEP